MSLFTHGPNCIMDSSGACLVAAELTESIRCDLCFNRKDITRIVLNSCDLCGVIATGEI